MNDNMKLLRFLQEVREENTPPPPGKGYPNDMADSAEAARYELARTLIDMILDSPTNH